MSHGMLVIFLNKVALYLASLVGDLGPLKFFKVTRSATFTSLIVYCLWSVVAFHQFAKNLLILEYIWFLCIYGLFAFD